MLRTALHRLIRVSALIGALGFSLAYAQTPSSSYTIAGGGMVQSNRLEAATTNGKSAVLLGGPGGPVFHTMYATPGPGTAELPPVVNAPLSAMVKREDITTLLDGNRIVQTSSNRLARDSQGRTRVEQVFWPMRGSQASLPVVVQVSDPITGESFTLNMQQKTANVFPLIAPAPVLQAPVAAPPIFPQMSSPFLGLAMSGLLPQSQTQETALGEKTIEGIKVIGTRVDYSLPANSVGNEKPITVRLERWFSPELGVTLLSTQQSAIGYESTYKLEQIDRREPDRSLFTVPADFTKEDLSEKLQQFRRFNWDKAPPSN